jgi:G:T-mismatch repair DNA endonuclease (very short patch repair protein)
MENLKTQIKEFLDVKYGGSFRFLKDKMFIKQFGDLAYKKILDETEFLNGTKYAFSVRVRSFLEGVTTNPICNCGKPTIFNPNNGWQASCSRSCHMKSPERMEKLKATNLRLYGVDNYFASDAGKNRVRESNIEKYGVDNYAKSKEYKDRIASGDICKNTNAIATSISHRRNYYDSLVNGGIVIPLFPFEEYQGWGDAYKMYNWKCVECGFEYEAIVKYNKHIECRKCKPTGSKLEIFIKDLLDELNIPFIYRDRKILDGDEIDIYVPSYNLGIELHGLYWHTEAHKKNDLHKSKADLAELKGIRLIQIFEDELKQKKDIVVGRIKNLLQLNGRRIFARKCKIKQITSEIKKEFVNKNHIQGNSNTSINYGLFYNDELVSIMTFGKLNGSRGKIVEKKDDTYELNRFCCLIGTTVVGGASKLLRRFISDYSPKRIISYADKRWSSGELYKTLGFDFLYDTTPNYWYTKDFIKREHRYNYRLDLLKEKLEMFDDTKTERENMENNGFMRIWDAGSKKFKMDL